MNKILRFACLIVLTVIVSGGCTSNSDQEEFERQAFITPANITRTTAGGEVQQNDPDDWRIAPMFQGFAEIIQPPYPNPSAGQRFTLEILVTGLESIFGLEIYTRTTFGRPVLIYTDSRRPLPPGLTDVLIEPAWLSASGTYSGAIGLHRIFIYDASGNMITYGDLQVD
ncbi:MAG: lipoprotein of unknown function DUF3359 [Bacteroidetes bacterium HLUCCA01]|nr:MAG: lipoprotein of unknown function DUF3359 [Bacteroidetes bacterium HLUCCA01]